LSLLDPLDPLRSAFFPPTKSPIGARLAAAILFLCSPSFPFQELWVCFTFLFALLEGRGFLSTRVQIRTSFVPPPPSFFPSALNTEAFLGLFAHHRQSPSPPPCTPYHRQHFSQSCLFELYQLAIFSLFSPFPGSLFFCYCDNSPSSLPQSLFRLYGNPLSCGR